VAYDFGVKRNILRMLTERGCELTVVPAKTTAAEVLAMKPDGVFFSNGPGDPGPCDYAISAAKEIIELYTWWTVTYRNRPDPMEASGWSAHCDAMRVKYPGSFFSSLNSKDPEDRKASNKAHKLMDKIEKAYAKEDEEMMIRLIKIRESLWT
jgi:hypothetical protein